jgi:GxxExxY protein
MGSSKYLHWEITQKIIGCAMSVHNCIGAGIQEVIYQRALAMEMEKQGLSFVREFEIPIHYDLREIGSRRVDFLLKKKLWWRLRLLVGLKMSILLRQSII